MNRLLLRASRRFYARHPWQLALAIGGISLGVAVYVGVALANDGARRAFEESAALLRGQTTHRLLPISGQLDESVYRDIVVDHGIAAAAPIVEGEVDVSGTGGGRFPLLGVDPVRESALRSFSGFGGGSGSMVRLMVTPGTALVPEELDRGGRPSAQGRDGHEATLPIRVRGRKVDLDVLGTVPEVSEHLDAEPPIVVDIATAQELLDKIGVLTRIDLKLTSEEAERLEAHLPAGTVLVPAEETDAAFGQLSGAFRTNLSALGLLALVVGMFLIYGTMSFAVVQRRSTLGVYAALGVSRSEVLATILLEAAALGALATAIGLVLGRILATALMGLVLQTIGDFYFTTAVAGTSPSPWIYALGAALGLGATVVAAAKPAIDAAKAGPMAAMRRADLERRARLESRQAAVWALPLLGGAGVLLVLPSRGLVVAFAALFLVLAAGALATPAAAVILMRLSEGPARRIFRLPGVLAVRGVSASLSRTGVATAALAVVRGHRHWNRADDRKFSRKPGRLVAYDLDGRRICGVRRNGRAGRGGGAGAYPSGSGGGGNDAAALRTLARGGRRDRGSGFAARRGSLGLRLDGGTARGGVFGAWGRARSRDFGAACVRAWLGFG